MSRYKRRKIVFNDVYKEEEIFDNRGVEKIDQFTTPKFKNPPEDQVDSIDYFLYNFKQGDRFFKLAQRFFNDPNLWYLIATFNRKPTEAHVKPGEKIKIPTNIAQAIEVLGW